MNGLCNANKRLKLFQLLNAENHDVIFLQETYLSNNKQALQWERDWGRKIFSNFGHINSKGTSLLFASHLQITNLTDQYDTNGRYLVVRAEKNSTPFTFMSIYAPYIISDRSVC